MIQPAAMPLYAAERLDMLRAANTVFDRPPHLPQAELAATSRAQAASTSVYLTSCRSDGGPVECHVAWCKTNYHSSLSLLKAVAPTGPRLLFFATLLSVRFCHWSLLPHHGTVLNHTPHNTDTPLYCVLFQYSCIFCKNKTCVEDVLCLSPIKLCHRYQSAGMLLSVSQSPLVPAASAAMEVLSVCVFRIPLMLHLSSSRLT